MFREKQLMPTGVCQTFEVPFWQPSLNRGLKVATEREIDLIVLGLRSSRSTRTQPPTHLPGLTAHQVVSLARCPVLTVRE